MAHRMKFLIWMMGEHTDRLMQYPHAKYLFDLIAMRARLPESTINDGLEVGEARIGVSDFDGFGGTKGSNARRYRTACKRLSEFGLATMRATKSGTIAKISNALVYDLFRAWEDEAGDKGETKDLLKNDKDKTKERQLTENKKKESRKKTKRERPPLDEFLGLMEDSKYDSLENPVFRTAYLEWITFREERKPPLTASAVKKDLDNALKVGPDVFVAWSAEAIERGYRGWYFKDKAVLEVKNGRSAKDSDEVFTEAPRRRKNGV